MVSRIEKDSVLAYKVSVLAKVPSKSKRTDFVLKFFLIIFAAVVFCSLQDAKHLKSLITGARNCPPTINERNLFWKIKNYLRLDI
jgi:hypothetical protein